jgi:hypothetical protein
MCMCWCCDRTDERGNTKWHLAPLVHAAITGNLAVLDGIHRLTSDALSVLSSLIRDRYDQFCSLLWAYLVICVRPLLTIHLLIIN